MIAEPTFADAILDRLVHNAYRLTLDGPSMCKIKAAEAATASVTSDATDSATAESAQTKAKGVKR